MMLMIVKRFAGIEIGAYYAVAVAVSNVMINIGNLNVIGFQISDVEERYSFDVYLNLRKISVAFMLVISFVYVFVKGYIFYKSLIVFLYCVYRSVYAYADVYQGRYQQKGRVDLGSKLQFLKVLIPDSILACCIMFGIEIVVAILSAIIAEMALIFIYNKKHLIVSQESHRIKWRKSFELFRQCIPLFFSAFATTYIMNSSKYAIDRLLNNEMQVYYSIMLLPATIVHMVAGFIYRPMITEYAVLWDENQKKKFTDCVIKIIILILICTVMAEIAGVMVGIPLLEWLYAAPELKNYVSVFAVLLLAGGLNALNTFMIFVITIMRKQNHMLWIYGMALIMALVLPNVLVKQLGMTGASLSYLILILFQVLMIFIVFIRNLNR
jgi:O-antigen/teichoic acid export membrane protein